MTTIVVVVVIDIYLYDYYYLTGHSELPHGPLPSGPAASCITVVLPSRERSWLTGREKRHDQSTHLVHFISAAYSNGTGHRTNAVIDSGPDPMLAVAQHDAS